MVKGVTSKNEKLLREIGTKIIKLREDQKMSQEDLAYKAGIDRTYISGIEKGDRNISVTTYTKIASALGININLATLLNKNE